MFARLFNPDAPFWVAVGRIADLVWLNVLFVLTCLPIVTAGGALTALYDTVWRLGEDRGGSVTREYWRSLRENFWRSTGYWAFFLPIGGALTLSWIALPIAELAVIKVLLTLVYLIVFPFPWFLQARFSNTFWGTLKNSVVIPLVRLPFAFGVVLINIVLLCLVIWTIIDLPQIIPLFVLAGFAFPTAASMPLLNRAISPWTGTSTEEA